MDVAPDSHWGTHKGHGDLRAALSCHDPNRVSFRSKLWRSFLIATTVFFFGFFFEREEKMPLAMRSRRAFFFALGERRRNRCFARDFVFFFGTWETRDGPDCAFLQEPTVPDCSIGVSRSTRRKEQPSFARLGSWSD